MTTQDCIFCRIIAETVPATVIAETKLFLAILNIEQYADGHALILPKRHIISLAEFSPEESVGFFGEMLPEVTRALREDFGARAVRHWANDGPGAGQTQAHVHYQVLPFYGEEIPQRLIAQFKENMRQSAMSR